VGHVAHPGLLHCWAVSPRALQVQNGSRGEPAVTDVETGSILERKPSQLGEAIHQLSSDQPGPRENQKSIQEGLFLCGTKPKPLFRVRGIGMHQYTPWPRAREGGGAHGA
jgi:hypothetical protein